MSLRSISAAFAMAALFAIPANAQIASAPQASLTMVDQFYRGRAVIDTAVQAAGGSQTLRGVTALSITFAGDIFNDTQGYSPSRIGNPERDGAFSAENQFDFASSRFAQRTHQDLVGGFGLDFSTLYRGGVTYNLRNNGRQFTQNSSTPSPSASGGFVGVTARWTPVLLLQRAQQNFRTIAWVGEGRVGSADADIVEFSWDEGTRVRLFVTRADHLVRRCEMLAPDPINADEIAATEFIGGQTIAGLWFPQRIQSYRRGARNFDLEVRNVAINATLADEVFSPPTDYVQVLDDQITTTQISPRIYEVSGLGGGLYRSQFVVMDDFVVVFEAPLGVTVSRQIVGEIRRVAGEKPIRYVVLSHFHSDHAGGVGAYVDIGATIVAAVEAQPVIERYAASRSQFQGQEGYRTDVGVRFQPVMSSGYDIVDGGGHRLRVIGIAGTPHVSQMLALYDPETRTIMNGDLFSRLVRWNQTFDVFVAWLRRNDPTVETILGTHHEPITRAQLLSLALTSRRTEQR